MRGVVVAAIITVLAIFTQVPLLVGYVPVIWAGEEEWEAPSGEKVTIDQLINGKHVVEERIMGNMEYYDGKMITIEGEVIGDIMYRGDYAWITVNDDPYSLRKSLEEGGDFVGLSNQGIGVWVSREAAKKIMTCGGYKNKGDIVSITGEFHRACHEHGGDTDIHAANLEVISSGYAFSHPFSYGKLLAVMVLSLICIYLYYLRHQKIKKVIREE